MEFWEAKATYDDGYEIDKRFPYPLNDHSDSDQQYELEEWLLKMHDGCNWYNVNYGTE